jgi:hypothetical protein
MSRKALASIVSRALTDEEFRSQLLSDLETALSDYNLSDNEQQMVSKLDAEAFDELTMDLEARQSKSGFLGSLSMLGSKDAVDAGTLLDLLNNKYGS